VTEVERYLPGVPCWIDTGQPDPSAATAFYGGLFGWAFDDRAPAGAPGPYLVGRLGGRDVAAVAQSGEAGATPAWNTYIRADRADEAAARVRDAGGSVLAEPMTVGDAGRMAVCADPAGAVFSVWEAHTHRGAQLVNAPGTWNWSDLTTPAPEQAAAFYGAVFGWEADPVAFGDEVSWMWRMPGYGDLLERLNPGIRERHSEYGAPEGFTDAIGWMREAAGDTAPHWSVTFAVDDADAIAARAAELGGTVTVAPFDAGPARVAVLADPQGAGFTISWFSG
jgi:uncharacterized protein